MINSIDEIKALLTDHQIHYVTEGHNTKRGEISIKCPLCGDDDKSEHMGISPEGYWSCWRSREHSGRNINRLLRLLGIETKYNPVRGSLEDLISGKFFEETSMETEVVQLRPSKLPHQFKRIGNQMSDAKYRQYLVKRKFASDDLDQLIDAYNLMRSSPDDFEWTDRIIVASTTNGRVYWTGRSIFPNGLRYKSPKSEVANIKHSLLRYDTIVENKPKALLVTEGFFDCMKMGFYRPLASIETTCTFGVNVSDEQINLLKKLELDGVQILIGFDVDAIESALYTSTSLSNAIVLPFLLKGYKDYGDLPYKQVVPVWNDIIARIH